MSANRINKYDNLKGFAIILIVLGHFINFTTNDLTYFIHNYLQLIHLPIFFFVAGYFSKINEDQPLKAFKRLLIPYIIFCIIYALYKFYFYGETPDTLFIYPGRALWFLISLFTMKMMLPIIDKFRYPLIFAFAIAILSGFLNLDVLSLSRTFCYLPAFLVGFYYNDYINNISSNHNEFYQILSKKSSLIIIIAFTLISLVVLSYYLPFKMINLNHMYEAFFKFNMLMRFIIISIGIVFTLIMNRIMVNGENFLTKFGRNSMSVYVLHIFTILPLWRVFHYFNDINPIFAAVSLLVLTFLVVYILSRDIVAENLNRFTDGVSDLICR